MALVHEGYLQLHHEPNGSAFLYHIVSHELVRLAPGRWELLFSKQWGFLRFEDNSVRWCKDLLVFAIGQGSSSSASDEPDLYLFNSKEL